MALSAFKKLQNKTIGIVSFSIFTIAFDDAFAFNIIQVASQVI